jgi:hypothetical protein
MATKNLLIDFKAEYAALEEEHQRWYVAMTQKQGEYLGRLAMLRQVMDKLELAESLEPVANREPEVATP